ncbi:hypothetical protein BSKO_06319 [Bryopsis sp. KO-2023]|nr:hypothetical protein BSKO_06319 [Bryopsis sp. KO-2023]
MAELWSDLQEALCTKCGTPACEDSHMFCKYSIWAGKWPGCFGAIHWSCTPEHFEEGPCRSYVCESCGKLSEYAASMLYKEGEVDFDSVLFDGECAAADPPPPNENVMNNLEPDFNLDFPVELFDEEEVGEEEVEKEVEEILRAALKPPQFSGVGDRPNVKKQQKRPIRQNSGGAAAAATAGASGSGAGASGSGAGAGVGGSLQSNQRAAVRRTPSNATLHKRLRKVGQRLQPRQRPPKILKTRAVPDDLERADKWASGTTMLKAGGRGIVHNLNFPPQKGKEPRRDPVPPTTKKPKKAGPGTLQTEGPSQHGQDLQEAEKRPHRPIDDFWSDANIDSAGPSGTAGNQTPPHNPCENDDPMEEHPQTSATPIPKEPPNPTPIANPGLAGASANARKQTSAFNPWEDDDPLEEGTRTLSPSIPKEPPNPTPITKSSLVGASANARKQTPPDRTPSIPKQRPNPIPQPTASLGKHSASSRAGLSSAPVSTQQRSSDDRQLRAGLSTPASAEIRPRWPSARPASGLDDRGEGDGVGLVSEVPVVHNKFTKAAGRERMKRSASNFSSSLNKVDHLGAGQVGERDSGMLSKKLWTGKIKFIGDPALLPPNLDKVGPVLFFSTPVICPVLGCDVESVKKIFKGDGQVLCLSLRKRFDLGWLIEDRKYREARNQAQLEVEAVSESHREQLISMQKHLENEKLVGCCISWEHPELDVYLFPGKRQGTLAAFVRYNWTGPFKTNLFKGIVKKPGAPRKDTRVSFWSNKQPEKPAKNPSKKKKKKGGNKKNRKNRKSPDIYTRGPEVASLKEVAPRSPRGKLSILDGTGNSSVATGNRPIATGSSSVANTEPPEVIMLDFDDDDEPPAPPSALPPPPVPTSILPLPLAPLSTLPSPPVPTSVLPSSPPPRPCHSLRTSPRQTAPLGYPCALSDLHYTLIGYKATPEVILLIEQLAAFGATYVKTPRPGNVNLVSFCRSLRSKGVEGHLPVREYIDDEVIFVWGLSDFWSSFSPSRQSRLIIKQGSMCFPGGVLVVADDNALSTCEASEAEQIIKTLKEGREKVPSWTWKLKVAEDCWDSLLKLKEKRVQQLLDFLWAERCDPRAPGMEEKVFEFMQGNDRSTSTRQHPPQVVRDAMKMAFAMKDTCRFVFLLHGDSENLSEDKRRQVENIERAARGQTTVRLMSVAALVEKMKWIVTERVNYLS